MRVVAVVMLLLAVSAVPVRTASKTEESPQATPTAAAEEEPEAPSEFVPSEQVRVDNEVSFPVDI